MYKGEILNEIKSRVVFIALPETPSGPINFQDPSTRYLILSTPNNYGFLVPVFMDQTSLRQRQDKLVPHMIEFKTINSILENEFCMGIVFCTTKFEILYFRKDLSRVFPSIKLSN
jgi:hypothetical protein